MLTKVIEYKDFLNNDRKETHYFNLTKAEIAEMEMSKNGGLTTILERIIEAQDQEQLSKWFKDIILKSYGVVSPDGREFDKSEEVVKKFVNSKAYSELYMELILDANAMVSFVNGMIPEELRGNAKAAIAENTTLEQ